jgi:hypothetical protein
MDVRDRHRSHRELESGRAPKSVPTITDRDAIAVLKEKALMLSQENCRLREVLRLNLIRLDPTITPEEIDTIIEACRGDSQ